MKQLLEAGVNVNQQDGTGRSALHLASWFDHHKVVPLLLDYNAKIDLTDDAGHTPLHLACWFGHLKTCTILIDAGAPLDIQDSAGRTPLHFAVQHNRPEIVDLLLKKGANTKLKNTNGKTAEALAVADENNEIIDIIQRYSKENDIENQNISSAPTEKELYDEHNRMKATIGKLAEGRDSQVEQITMLRDKIEAQSATLSVLSANQSDLLDQMMNLQKLLRSIVMTLAATHPNIPITQAQTNINPLPIPHPKNQTTIGQSQRPIISGTTVASAPATNLPLCKVCGKNVATMRCRMCHSPVCSVCMPQIKQKGCPFCNQ